MLLRNVCALFLVLIALAANSQDYSVSKTRKALTSHEWELQYILNDDEKEDPPKSLKGLRLVFMPTKDLVYEYFPGSKDVIRVLKGKINEQTFKYEDRVEEPTMIIDMDKLDEGLLSFTEQMEKGSKYYVYARKEPIKGKGYPSTKYEVFDLDVPMQRLSPEVLESVKAINAELKKTEGNLFFIDKNKDRYLIRTVNFEATEYGVKFSLVYDSKSTRGRSYSYEFLPEHIDEITDVKVDPESKVGQIRIKLVNESCFFASSTAATSMVKTVGIDYFKETNSSFAKIKERFEDLQLSYEYGRVHRLDILDKFLDKTQKYWVSADGTNNTYKLGSYDVVGNKIYLHYNLESVGLTSNSSASYVTIVPLKDITGITVERTKSRPKTFLLHNKKKGFETWAWQDGKYLRDSPVKIMPLFNYGDGFYVRDLEEVLLQLIKDDGGDKLKTVYNP